MVKKSGERKKHSFLPFNERVAAIRIDPVRRVRREHYGEGTDRDSYLAAALTKWAELDLTTNFTACSAILMPISRSLPMVLHNQREIAATLLKHVRNAKDGFSGESLFDLIAAFARDLGPDFEPYFAETVNSCSEIVEFGSKSDSREHLILVEQAFNCLAYLFKYLSRLLVTDLTPTYNLISPLFGRESRQRAYVVRFAAESLAFLVRRCTGTSLVAIITYITRDSHKSDKPQYHTAAAELLADTLRGPGTGLHSKASLLIAAILDACMSQNAVKLAQDVLVSALHHVRRETAEPLYTAVLEWLRNNASTMDVVFGYSVLFVLCGHRKGDRVPEWTPIFDTYRVILKSKPLPLDGVLASAALISLADFGTSSRYAPELVAEIFQEGDVLAAICFTELVYRLAEDRSVSFLYPVLPKLAQRIKPEQAAQLAASTQKKLSLLTANSGTDLFERWWHLFLGIEPSMSEILAIDASDELLVVKAEIVGRLLDSSVSQDDLEAASALPAVPSLLRGLMHVKASPKVLENVLPHTGSCDKEVRQIAVKIINSAAPHDLLQQCALIDDIPYDVSNARNIAMHIRTLVQRYANTGSNSIIDSVVPRVVFGLLSSRFMPVWKAALEVMPKLGERNPRAVTELAWKWIENSKEPARPTSVEIESTAQPALDCTFLAQIQSHAAQIDAAASHPLDALWNQLCDNVHVDIYPDLRILAIRALQKIPKAAEREIALKLVPMVLQPDDDGNDEEVSFKERVAVLELFAMFRGVAKWPQYPQLLERYLYFLGSRHLPLQKLALKLLLALQTPEANVWNKYRDHLEALLDNARVRDELAILLTSATGNDDEAALAIEDRETVLPIVLRILYGQTQSSGDGIRRRTVFAALWAVGEPRYLIEFLALAVSQVTFGLASDSRKQLGMLSFVQDLLGELQSGTAPLLTNILDTALLPVLEQPQLLEETWRAVRQQVTKCIDSAFSHIPDSVLWLSCWPLIYRTLIEPQLTDRFAQRNLEQPSALMHLFKTLSTESFLRQLLSIDSHHILRTIESCLTFETVKESVVIIILSTLQNCLEADELRPIVVNLILPRFSVLLRRDYSPSVVALTIGLLRQILVDCTRDDSDEHLEDLSSAILDALSQSSRSVPTNVKAPLLESLSALLIRPQCPQAIVDRSYFELAPLFRQFGDPRVRTQLASCYAAFGQRDVELIRVGKLVTELNAFDATRLGQPDFDRRLSAFSDINDKLWKDLSEKEWLPLVHIMFFMARDPEELALRENAGYSLRRVVDGAHERLVHDLLLPNIRRNLRESDERLRRIWVELMAHIVRSPINVLDDCRCLLFEGDEEADFFNNIVHIQTHRRRRAVQRVAAAAPELSGTSIAHFLLPIIEHFVAFSGSEDGERNNLADDSLSAIAALAQHLTWNQYRAVTRRYVSLIESRPATRDLRKNVKLVGAAAQALSGFSEKLSMSARREVLTEFVAPLHSVVSAKSNEHENLPERIPLAVPVVQFVVALGEEAIEAQLSSKLAPLCQLLRSRTPEIRDAVRATLGRSVRILGAQYLPYALNELRSSLRRGAQLHILGFTVHSLLVELRPVLEPGSLDNSATALAQVVMEDVFGTTGQEKDSEGYTSASREVRNQKSFDTMEIASSHISLSALGLLIDPIREYLLSTSLTQKAERKVEDVLRRMSAGLRHNPECCSQNGLIAAYQVHKRCMEDLKEASNTEDAENTEINDRLAAKEAAARESEAFFTVQLSSRNWSERHAVKRRFAENLHVMESFCLTIVRYILGSKQGDSLLNVANVKGLIPLMEYGIESDNEDMQISAIRLATHALRIPIPDMEDTLIHLSRRVTALFQSTPRTDSELAQTCIKFLTMILRHKSEVSVRPTTTGEVLDRLSPDIEEPDRQGTAIAYVRAVLSRQLIIPQIYDMMDRISKTMVTNPSALVRSACRASYLQFILTYPHGKSRFDRYLNFLTTNLQYPSPAGRLSVLEMIRMLLAKVMAEQLDSARTAFFAALVLVIVNDDDGECRADAVAAVRDLLERAPSPEFYANFVSQWLSQSLDSNKGSLLVRGGLEVATMMLERGIATETLRSTVADVVSKILGSAQRESSTTVAWQIVYLALGVYARQGANLDKEDLELVSAVLLFPHPWVRARATRIFGDYFKDLQDTTKLPLVDHTQVVRRFVRQLGAPKLNEADALQTVKNIVYVLRTESQTAQEDLAAWIVNKLGYLIRTNASSSEGLGGRTAAVQVLAMLPSVFPNVSTDISREVILALQVLADQLEAENAHKELHDLAQEALGVYEKALGPTIYLQLYGKAREYVQERRRDRRSKRSIEAVTNPAVSARKKLKRNSAKKDARRRKK